MPMNVRMDGAQKVGQTTVVLTCPSCNKEGTFDSFADFSDFGIVPDQVIFHLGIRRCPNPECHQAVFIALDRDANVVHQHPAPRPAIDTKGVPTKIETLWNEAMDCFANQCYRASAMMLRRVVEEVCEHESAKGDTLVDRLKALSAKVVLSPSLLDAATELRLLRNDAAHVKAKAYTDIGEKEIAVSISLLSEILRAIYHHQQLLTQLQSLRTDPEPTK